MVVREDMDLRIGKKNQKRVLEKVGFYDISRAIGKGNFAIVRLAKHRLVKCKVAIKIVDKTRIGAENLVKIEREVRVLKTVVHPHIVKLFEIMRTDQYIYIVTEFAHNGELFEVLATRGKFSEAESRRYFQQIVSAVAYCHHRGIVHRDIKAENILLDKNNNVKLIDFGFSNFHQPDLLMSTWCGSPPYAAPELLLGKDYDGRKADIWSLGVVLFIMVTGGFPFAGDSVDKLKNAVVACQLKIPFFVTPNCNDLLKKMIVVYPERRLNIDAIASHRWVVEDMPERLRKLIKEKAIDRLDPDIQPFQVNKTISFYMQRFGSFSEASIAEEVLKKNYESPVFGTYELFRAKLEKRNANQEPADVALRPRRGSRGSITTGKANMDNEPPAPLLPARTLAILGLLDSSDEEVEEDSEEDDVSLSPAESWLRHAAQLGVASGIDEPSPSANRTETRRHTLVGTSDLTNLFITQQLMERNPLAAAVIAMNQAAAAAAYATRLMNPFLNPMANVQMPDALAQYNPILALPSFERRASAGDPATYINPQLPDQTFNPAMHVNGLLSLNPNGPSTSGASALAAAVAANANAAAHGFQTAGMGALSVEEEGEIGPPIGSSGIASARRSPYTRQPVIHERRSSWASMQQNLTSQQQVKLERLYRQSVGSGDQTATNIQQLQKEFKELNANLESELRLKSIEVQHQPNCPPMISITDENNCVQMNVAAAFFGCPGVESQEEDASFESDATSDEPEPHSPPRSAMELMPPSENSVLISYLETDIVLQHLRSTLDTLDIVYEETAHENHRICVENGEKSRIEIDVIPVPLSISQAKSRIEFNCTGMDTTGCGELCTELIKKLKIVA